MNSTEAELAMVSLSISSSRFVSERPADDRLYGEELANRITERFLEKDRKQRFTY